VYQTVVPAADGSAPAAICRHADELIIRESSFIKEIRPWSDDSAVDPGTLTVDLLRERYRLSGRRGSVSRKRRTALLPYYYDLLRAAMPDAVELVDASDLVSELRLIKSPAELAYMRRAAEIMDQAFTAGFAVARPGARECDVNAAVLHILSTLRRRLPGSGTADRLGAPSSTAGGCSKFRASTARASRPVTRRKSTGSRAQTSTSRA
jgi:Xaa-Pro dipeptidase